MKFDFVIGNPPYQEERQGESKTALPVYYKFMDEAYKIGNSVELITPARFLFNAGRTPKKWNQKMLSDSHLKVMHYEGNGQIIFPNTDIKGGVAITYRDCKKNYGPIEIFTVYPELNSILKRVQPHVEQCGAISSIIFVASKFNTDNLFQDYPQYFGHERRMSSNVLDFDCFHNSEENEDVKIYGLYNGKREFKYIASKYVDLSDNIIAGYKIILPKADGNGSFGETLTTPEILEPMTGFTHTFMGVDCLDSVEEARAVLKYIKTKFARTMLQILKVTQDNNSDKWALVPLQDFTPNSDIDWSGSVADIDRQLYRKYSLSEDEISFIEEKVKEMV